MDLQKLINNVNQKKIIFTVTPGRSGTTLLTRILEILPDTASFHEEYPGYDHVLRYVQTNPAMALQFIVNSKLPHIVNTNCKIYAETSHVLCKGFLEAYIKLGVNFKLIDLRRHPREVASSMYGYNSIPGRTIDGLAHYLSPNDPAVLPMPHWTNLHDYQICFWHSLEIERRQRKYTSWMKNTGSDVHTIKMHNLCDFDSFIELCKVINIDDGINEDAARSKHQEIVSVNQNPKNKFREIDFDRDKLEMQVLNLISSYEPYLWADVKDFYGNNRV